MANGGPPGAGAGVSVTHAGGKPAVWAARPGGNRFTPRDQDRGAAAFPCHRRELPGSAVGEESRGKLSPAGAWHRLGGGGTRPGPKKASPGDHLRGRTCWTRRPCMLSCVGWTARDATTARGGTTCPVLGDATKIRFAGFETSTRQHRLTCSNHDERVILREAGDCSCTASCRASRYGSSV